ncbi:unnamed protein product [Euphydryas editha]|uniref:ZAD domain-containing protein n=1 Tax=Euphydryas editha TaxID=104508 RepID=A0AAU9UHF2_EUPED|nr:unnamed protein product [Euphydryas editha]
MEISRQYCRLCLSTTDFKISLFSNYCQKTNMLDKIVACLKLSIEQSDYLTTICYKCADNIERYYDFLISVKKTQSKITELKSGRILGVEPRNVNRRHVTSYVREQVIDADYTFSFLDISNNEDKQKHETRPSSPFFSYFSPPNMLSREKDEPSSWKKSRARFNNVPKIEVHEEPQKRSKIEKLRHHSRDLFESQSQDLEESEVRSLDWKLTPDETLIRRVREKCFGRSDF